MRKSTKISHRRGCKKAKNCFLKEGALFETRTHGETRFVSPLRRNQRDKSVNFANGPRHILVFHVFERLNANLGLRCFVYLRFLSISSSKMLESLTVTGTYPKFTLFISLHTSQRPKKSCFTCLFQKELPLCRGCNYFHFFWLTLFNDKSSCISSYITQAHNKIMSALDRTSLPIRFSEN